MKTWKELPRDPVLAEWIDAYWFIEREAGDALPERPQLNPNASVHLILAPPHQAYHYQMTGGGKGSSSAAEASMFIGLGSHWLFPHTKTLSLDHSQPFSIVGVRLRPGALYALEQENISIKQRASPLVNHVSGASDGPWLGLAEWDTDALLPLARTNQQACAEYLDRQLKPWLAASQPDKHSQLVCRVLRALLPLDNQTHTPLAQLGAQLHCSQRTLERAFLRVTGLTLKQAQSMERLEAILQQLYGQSEAEIDWAEVAQRFGFSDQPHLIRYLKSQLGQTPGQYARQRDVTIDVYGDFSDE